MKDSVERLLGLALLLFGAAWLLDRAWRLTRPLLPLLIVVATAAAFVRLLVRRRL